jgi:hypothetical protein
MLIQITESKMHIIRNREIFRQLKYGGICLFLTILIVCVLTTCRSPQKTELRKFLPNDAIIYLEIENIARALESLTAGQAFQKRAGSAPDYTVFENMQIAVVVTGFEKFEESQVLSFKPRFVAIAETHAWSWQTVSLAENQLTNFVRKNFGGDAKLEKTERDGDTFFTWTASDDRRVFAFVRGSLIYFGTDAAAIEKCLGIQKGEAENLMNNEPLSHAYTANNLAFGYVSPEGVKQIAALAGVSVAVETTDEADGRGFIAEILPQILQNTTREIVWTANKTERGIKDVFSTSLTTDTASILKETLATTAQPTGDSIDFLPIEFYSATRYNLESPLTAWRGLLFVTAENTNAVSGNLLLRFSDSLLEPYGISDAETFLSQIDSEILTAQFDAAGEQSAAIVTVKDAEKLKSSISKEINFQLAPTKQSNAEIWFSEDRRMAAAFVENNLILGDEESVLKCLKTKQSAKSFAETKAFQLFSNSKSAAATFGIDYDSAEKIVGVLAVNKNGNEKLATFYFTETRFDEKGIERVTVSDFGLLGTILKQLEK